MAGLKSNVNINPHQVTLIDQGDLSNIYIGIAKVGAATAAPVWQIRKIGTNGSLLSIQYASGTAAFSKIWDNRASYVYS